MLNDDMKATCIMTSLDVLTHFHQEGNDFLNRIVTGDETWVYHDTPETKRQSMQWKHTTLPVVTKFKKTLTQKKLMTSIFWDRKGVLLIDYMKPGTTINSDRYRETLTKLRKAIKTKRVGLLTASVVLLHENARPHSAGETCDLITKFGWDCLPHPPYSPNLAPSDYHLFPALKLHLGASHFNTNEELRNHVCFAESFNF